MLLNGGGKGRMVGKGSISQRNVARMCVKHLMMRWRLIAGFRAAKLPPKNVFQAFVTDIQVCIVLSSLTGFTV